jgi:hypothetical protein
VSHQWLAIEHPDESGEQLAVPWQIPTCWRRIMEEYDGICVYIQWYIYIYTFFFIIYVITYLFLGTIIYRGTYLYIGTYIYISWLRIVFAVFFGISMWCTSPHTVVVPSQHSGGVPINPFANTLFVCLFVCFCFFFVCLFVCFLFL